MALSPIDATLIAAGIGGLFGVLGGVAGRLTAGRIDRRSERKQRQLQDLIAAQDVLIRLNRLHYRVVKYWRLGSNPADELWEEFVGARGEALALNQRIVDDALRGEVEHLRQYYAVQLRADAVESERTRIDASYESVQLRLGQEVRDRLR